MTKRAVSFLSSTIATAQRLLGELSAGSGTWEAELRSLDLSPSDATSIIIQKMSLPEMLRNIPNRARWSCPPDELALPAVLHMYFSALWLAAYLSTEGAEIDLKSVVSRTCKWSFPAYTETELNGLKAEGLLLMHAVLEQSKTDPKLAKLMETHRKLVGAYILGIDLAAISHLNLLFVVYKDLQIRG